MGPRECRSGQTRKSTIHRLSSRNRCAPLCSDIFSECPKLERGRPPNKGTCVCGENTDYTEQNPSKACKHLKLQAVNVPNRVGFARSLQPKKSEVRDSMQDFDHILGSTQIVRLGRSETDLERVDGHDVSDVTLCLMEHNGDMAQILFNATTMCNSSLKSTYSFFSDVH